MVKALTRAVVAAHAPAITNTDLFPKQKRLSTQSFLFAYSSPALHPPALRAGAHLSWVQVPGSVSLTGRCQGAGGAGECRPLFSTY